MYHSPSRNHIAIFGLALSAFLAGSPLTSRAADATPSPFSQAKISEVVNDVSISPAADPSSKTVATQGMDFKAPDIIQTGRRSRAQLTAADGTIARVGSNTVFSLDPTSRTINLKEGSVLFNSPKGIGGGTIVTNSATATVTGTTIIVTATADGGFKLLVLEGTATMKLANGQTITLSAGQMSFVLPASKGGGAGPVLNFDLKQQAQNSSLVNGFTVTLPSQSLIVDATQLQQQKIQSGQLTETGQVVVGANGANQVVLATVNTVDTVPQTQTTLPDFVLGPSSETPLPSANTFTSPVTVSAADLGLPSGVIPNDSIAVTGLIGNNVSASGYANLSSLDGLGSVDILAKGTFDFTESKEAIVLDSPSLAGSGSGGNSLPITPSDHSSFTEFTGLSSTLSLNLVAKNGFQFFDQSSARISYYISADFSPTSFSTPTYYHDNIVPGVITPALATPAINFSVSIPTFQPEFSMVSVLQDLDLTGVEIYSENSAVYLQSVLGGVYGNNTNVYANGDVSVVSSLDSDGINFYDTRIYTGSGSTISLVAGVGDIVVSAGDSGSTLQTGSGSDYSGTVNLIAAGNITVTGSTIESFNKNFIAGGTLSVSSSSINNDTKSLSGSTYTFAGDTVNLTGISFPNCSTLNLYSMNGTINSNTSIVVAGAVNIGSDVTWDGKNLVCIIGNKSFVPDVGLTSDNATVQTALGTPLAITSETSSFSSTLVFSNVLFSPSQLGESTGDTTYAVIHGLIAGAVTINGALDLSDLDSFNSEGDLAAKSIALSGCVAISPPDGAKLLQLHSMGNLTFVSGTDAFDNSGCFSLSLFSVQLISLNNASLSDSMGNLTLDDVDGGISITNGSSITSGSSDGTSGNLNLNTENDTAAILISNSTLSTYRGPVTITSDNITINNLSNITALCNTVSLSGGLLGISVNNSTLNAGSMSTSLVNLYSNGNIAISNNSTLSSYTGTDTEYPHIVLTAAHVVTVTNSIIQTSFSSTNAVDSINATNVTYSNASQVNMRTSKGDITLSNVDFDTADQINLQAGGNISASNVTTTGSYEMNMDADKDLTASNVNATNLCQINLEATGNLTAQTLNTSSEATINMSARTINLSNINFASGSTVNLTSLNGQLAPNPNTNAASVVGDVNFVHNVNYGGSPAQNFVPTAVGGAGTGTNLPIHINNNR